jgi:Flp pilus assembly protein TadG
MAGSPMSQSRLRRERGQDLAEFALIFPVLFFILMVIFDFGRATYYGSALHNAAREGARYGIIHPDDVEGIQALVADRAVAVPAPAVAVNVNYPAEGVIEVTAHWTMSFVTPLIGNFFDGGVLPLGSRSTMRIER